MRKLLNAILFVTILFVSADSAANPNSNVSDITFEEISGNTERVGNRTVRYSVFYQSPLYNSGGSYNNEFVSTVLERSSVEIFRFIDENSIRYVECSPDLKLNIYHISSSYLNDHSRFRDWGPSNNVQDKNTFTLWALYDPMKQDRFNASIFLTDHGMWANEILIAHEVAHYWFTRFCMTLTYSSGTEDFAKKFERYYEAKMNRGFNE